MHIQDRQLITGAFTNQFKELCADLESVFKDDVEVRTACTAMRGLLTANPKLLTQTFYERVAVPYDRQFEAGNCEFFLKKDYTEDLQLKNSSAMLRKIESLKEPISKLDTVCQLAFLKYFANLSKLSRLLFDKS